MMARLLAVFVLLVIPLSAWTQEVDAPNAKPAANPVVVTYPVADLVLPIGGLDYPRTNGNEEGSTRTKEEWLIQKITRTVAAGTWVDKGGTGTIQYIPKGMALVVKQSPQVQAQVKNILTALKRAQDIEVSMEMRVVTVSSSFYNGMGLVAPNREKDGLMNLSEIQVFMLLEAAQGDARADVMQAPKITAFPGQKIWFNVAGKVGCQSLCDGGRKIFIISIWKSRPPSARLNLRKPRDLWTAARWCWRPAKIK